MTNLKRKARAWDRLQADIDAGEAKVVFPYIAKRDKFTGCGGRTEYGMIIQIEELKLQLNYMQRRYESLLGIVVQAKERELPPVYIMVPK